jgi:hypothetical protein
MFHNCSRLRIIKKYSIITHNTYKSILLPNLGNIEAMKEIIGSKSFFVINLLFLISAPFLLLAEHEQDEIKAQGEHTFVALNSSSANIDENDTDVLSNDSLPEEKMQIQICDASHPC